MLAYILKEIRNVDHTVWWVACSVTVALVVVVGWHEYQDAHKAPHVSSPAAVVTHG
jgi:hypothetical protein